jgi:type VI secretion system protein
MLLKRFYRKEHQAEATEIASILANLNQLLNTKKGFGSWIPKYGIGDYNEFRARRKIIETLRAEIEENIATFEPRVKLDKIDAVGSTSPFRLKFQISGSFAESARPIYIVVDSVRNNVHVERG